jgi:hypothetical protein
MRRKHGLPAQAEVQLVDQLDGVLVVKAARQTRPGDFAPRKTDF